MPNFDKPYIPSPEEKKGSENNMEDSGNVEKELTMFIEKVRELLRESNEKNEKLYLVRIREVYWELGNSQVNKLILSNTGNPAEVIESSEKNLFEMTVNTNIRKYLSRLSSEFELFGTDIQNYHFNHPGAGKDNYTAEVNIDEIKKP